jgi:cell division protease FtsH
MGESIGLMHCAKRPAQFLPTAIDGAGWQRDCSEESARKIDEEVKKTLDDAYAEAKRLLRDHRDKLDSIAAALLQTETLDAKTFLSLLDPRSPSAAPSGKPPQE